MTDQELKDLVASLAIQSAKTDAKLNKIATMYGGVANNQGKVVEEFYFNTLKAKPVLGTMKFDFIDKNITRSKGAIQDEYDIILVNGKDVFIIEVKYKAHENDLNRLLNKKYPNFKILYPEYKNYTHHLALATFHIEEELIQKALKNNVNILRRKGNIIEELVA
ncbi:MAG: hypothetical protein ACPGTO_04605 [Polaribacter sp.]